MEDDVENLCGKILLIGREKPGIRVMEEEMADDRRKRKRCLVGRIGTEKKINKEAFKGVLY
jgi:hypothetical protein